MSMTKYCKKCRGLKALHKGMRCPTERLIVVRQEPVAIHFPLNTTDEQVNEYLDAIEMGHCGWEDDKQVPSGADERWARLE